MTGQDQIKLWRDDALGASGVDMLAGRCFSHRYRPHFHEEYVIAAFVGGAQRHRIGRHRGVASPGSVMIIRPGETHTGEAAGTEGWSYRAFYPDAGAMSEIARDLFKGSRASEQIFDGPPLREDAALARRLAALHRLIDVNVGDPLARQQAFATAMVITLTRSAGPGATLREAQPELAAIRRAMDCADARFAEQNLGTADLASAAKLSSYHFMRSFRAATGVTAHAYVVQRRIREARVMLARGALASDVACAVGFADQSHLIRHFRSALGVTPGQYARETRRRVRAS